MNESKFLQLAMATAVQLVVLYSMNDESTRIIILLNKKSNLKPINSSISCATIIRFVVSATYKTKTNRRRIACLAWTNKSIDHIADMLQMICLHIFTIRGRKAAGG